MTTLFARRMTAIDLATISLYGLNNYNNGI